jgi:putative PIN family toxin of toxin-antitoxin system
MVVGKLLGHPTSSSAEVLRAIATGDILLALSDDFLRELVDVAGRYELQSRMGLTRLTLEAGLTIGLMGTLYHPHRLEWPSLNDPKDGWLLDLAFYSGADYIVTWDSHLDAARPLGFQVLNPPNLLGMLH